MLIHSIILAGNLMTSGWIFSTLPSKPPADPLFEPQSLLEITVEADLTALINDIAYDRDYHRAVISYLNDYGFHDMIPLKIKTRGNFRRGRDNCNFPPFLLNFSKEWVAGTIFEGRNKVKLVTHCVTEESVYNDYILKEFLVYRLFSSLTEYSFKVRLARVTYVDSEDVLDTIVRYGVIIEDDKSLADRIHGVPARVIITSKKNPDYYLSSLVSVFQFMIGNTDWYLPDHNMQLFAIHDGRDTLAIPYDFDLSGFVNPHYSTQFRNYDLSSPEERYYLGFCRPPEEMEKVLKMVGSKEPVLLSEIRNFEHLDPDIRAEGVRYLEEFFSLLKEDKFMPAMNSSCNDEF